MIESDKGFINGKKKKQNKLQRDTIPPSCLIGKM